MTAPTARDLEAARSLARSLDEHMDEQGAIFDSGIELISAALSAARASAFAECAEIALNCPHSSDKNYMDWYDVGMAIAAAIRAAAARQESETSK